MGKIKNFTKNILYYTGYYHLVRSWRELIRPGKKLVILTYHDISDDAGCPEGSYDPFKFRPEISIQQFELHLRILKKFYNVVSLEEGVRWLQKGGKGMDKLAVITFDDGYESFYTLAFPLLKKYNFPATMFLPTDFVNSRRMFWWDELHQIVFYAVRPPTCASALVPFIGERLSKMFSEVKKDLLRTRQFLESLELYLSSIEDAQRQEKIENLKKLVLADQRIRSVSPRTLSWNQIAEVSREGISIGSHTCSHSNLKFASLEKVEEELARSKEIIEKQIKTKVICFAYPYLANFETHLRVKPILVDLKYEYACAGWGGANLSDFDPFFLRRMTLPMTTATPLITRELLLS